MVSVAVKRADGQFADPVPENRRDPMSVANEALVVFSEITDCLSGLRGMQVRMNEDLDAYRALVDACIQATAAFDELATGTAATRAALRPFHDPEEVRKVAAEAQLTRQYLQSIARTGRALSAISSLSRTTAASFGVTALNSYLDDLSMISARIQGGSQTVADHLRLVFECRKLTQNSLALVQRSLDAIATNVSAAQEELVGLEARERDAAMIMSRKGDDIKAASRQQIKGFVTAIQFADRLAQRLDHLGTILEHDDPHIRALARAQAHSISGAMRVTATQTRSCMDAIASLSEDGSRLFLAGTIADTIQESLFKRDQAAQRVAQGMNALDSNIRGTRTLIDRTMDAHEKVENHFGILAVSSKQVATTAINSVLLVSRGGPAQGALTALSAEVRLTATQCLAAVGGCQAALNVLVELTTHSQAEIVKQADCLSEAVVRFRKEIAASKTRLDELNALSARAGERIDTMLSVVASVTDGVQRVLDLADSIDAIAEDLDIAAPDNSAPDPAILASIWDIYTMDEERSVHAEVFADFGVTAPQAVTSDLDDDFLL
ncbi:MAG: hypothetical protein NXH83_13820 [Rhodobacteraceae bacterium]|nr:hypothetical protein [Paracoccaceae bacterium]